MRFYVFPTCPTLVAIRVASRGWSSSALVVIFNEVSRSDISGNFKVRARLSSAGTDSEVAAEVEISWWPDITCGVMIGTPMGWGHMAT